MRHARTDESPNERIRRLREKKGWTQEELATIADVSPRTIRRAEGARTMSPETRKAVASALGIDSAELAAPETNGRELQEPLTLLDGRSLIHALQGFKTYRYLASDTQAEGTADLVKLVLSAIDTAKRWHELSLGEQYDAQRRFTPAIEDLYWLGWRVGCFQYVRQSKDGHTERDHVTLLVIDMKPDARATLADPAMLESEIASSGVAREERVKFLLELVDGERLTILEEGARRLSLPTEKLAKTIASLGASVHDQAAFSAAIDRAAASLQIKAEDLLMVMHELMEWMYEFTLFKERHGYLHPRPKHGAATPLLGTRRASD